MPAWFISIDLRKAFDRVEQAALFRSLREQNVDDGYICLLRVLYEEQQGIVGESHAFSITCGARQGDVLSPILVNCISDIAFQR